MEHNEKLSYYPISRTISALSSDSRAASPTAATKFNFAAPPKPLFSLQYTIWPNGNHHNHF